MSSTIHYNFEKLTRGDKYWETTYNDTLDLIDATIYHFVGYIPYGTEIKRSVSDSRLINSELTRLEDLINDVDARIVLAAVLTKTFTADEEYTLNHLLEDTYCNMLIDRYIAGSVNKWYKEDFFLTTERIDANNVKLKNELPESANYIVLAFSLKS